MIKPWTLIYVRSDEKTNYVKHKGHDCCRKFIGDLNHLTKTADGKDRDVIAFAHNGQRFDLTFIQRALYEDKVETSNQLMNGAKTLSFTYSYEDSQVQFKDSMCFLPCPCMQLVKRLNYKLLKVFFFFPHALQTADSLLYTGEFPSRDKFNPNHMKKDRRDDFLEWHAKEQKRFEEQGLVYDLQKEKDFPCETDVKVLRDSCQQFSERFQERCGFSPLREDVTIAAACNGEFKLLQAYTIAKEPINGWGGYNVNQSNIAFEWLAFQEKKVGAGKLLRLRNDGEQKVLLPTGWKFVDG